LDLLQIFKNLTDRTINDKKLEINDKKLEIKNILPPLTVERLIFSLNYSPIQEN
jgi:hypothetical protein